MRAWLGRDVVSNAPPSPGGTLIAFVLAILERLGRSDPAALVAAMEQAQLARDEDFLEGLYREGFADCVPAPAIASMRPPRPAPGCWPGRRPVARRRRPRDGLGSTTHIAVVDAAGACASVTCSNGSGSGVIVPGTGVQLNNMMGEQDLNPLGFHSTLPGRRMPSMMSPTVALREGEVELVLGSAGSNRIRSAVLQTLIRSLADGMPIDGRRRCAPPALRGRHRPRRAGRPRGGPRGERPRARPLERRRTSTSAASTPSSATPSTGALDAAGDHRRGGAAELV